MKALGLVVAADLRRPTAHPALWLGAMDEATHRGYALLLLHHDQPEGSLAELAARTGVAGMLLDCRPRQPDGPDPDPGMVAVWMNQHLRANCVHADERRAGRQAAESLLARGHRRVAYFTLRAAAVAGEGERRAGFELAMRQARAEALMLAADDIPWGDRVAFARAAARHPAGPTAYVAGSVAEADLLAGVLAVDGVAIPRDRSLVAIDADPSPRFTTLQIPLSEIGSLAASMLIERLGRPGSRPPVALPCMLVEGHSLAPRS